MDKSILLAWFLVGVAAVTVVYTYLKQDKTYFDHVKEQLALTNAKLTSTQTQLKEIREDNEKLRKQFQDFNRIKTEADNVLCNIRDVMQRELEFHRGALHSHKAEVQKVHDQYEKTREVVRQLDLTCSELRGKSQPVSLGPVSIELKVSESAKKGLGKGINAIINDGKKGKK